jgi:hypothetical protein
MKSYSVTGLEGVQGCKNVAIFWDTALYNPYENQHFGGQYRRHLLGRVSAEQETRVQPVTRQMATTAVRTSNPTQGFKMPRIPYCLENRLRDGDENVSLKRRPRFTSWKIPGTHFY